MPSPLKPDGKESESVFAKGVSQGGCERGPIADQADVGALENRRVGIVVDSDHRAGPLQPNRMIRCAAETDCEIKAELDRLAGEPDLQLPRHPALVRHPARGA